MFLCIGSEADNLTPRTQLIGAVIEWAINLMDHHVGGIVDIARGTGT